MKALIVKLTAFTGPHSTLFVNPDPLFMVVDAEDGEELDNGYQSDEEARKIWKDFLIAPPGGPKEYAKASWCAEDLKGSMAHEIRNWSDKEVEEFLAEKQSKIADFMVTSGWEIIDELVAERNREKEKSRTKKKEKKS